jgi:hypothetical protein
MRTGGLTHLLIASAAQMQASAFLRSQRSYPPTVTVTGCSIGRRVVAYAIDGAVGPLNRRGGEGRGVDVPWNGDSARRLFDISRCLTGGSLAIVSAWRRSMCVAHR